MRMTTNSRCITRNSSRICLGRSRDFPRRNAICSLRHGISSRGRKRWCSLRHSKDAKLSESDAYAIAFRDSRQQIQKTDSLCADFYRPFFRWLLDQSQSSALSALYFLRGWMAFGRNRRAYRWAERRAFATTDAMPQAGKHCILDTDDPDATVD